MSANASQVFTQEQVEIFNYGTLHLEWTTALFIFVLFSITMILMNSLLLKPLVRTLEGRESLLDAGAGELEGLEKELADLKASFQDKQQGTIEELSRQMKTAQDEAKAQASQTIEAAQSAAEGKLSAAQTELEKDRETAMTEAKTLSSELAALIQNKVLN